MQPMCYSEDSERRSSVGWRIRDAPENANYLSRYSYTNIRIVIANLLSSHGGIQIKPQIPVKSCIERWYGAIPRRRLPKRNNVNEAGICGEGRRGGPSEQGVRRPLWKNPLLTLPKAHWAGGQVNNINCSNYSIGGIEL